MTIHKCPCGHPACNQYTLDTQSSVGFDKDVATLYDAAPDLLAALLQAEMAVEELCYDQDPDYQCWVTLATVRTAIAKAKGETA